MGTETPPIGSRSITLTRHLSDLADWHLTDNPVDLDRWTFPSAVVPPGGYLIVFASGSDAVDPAGNLHTNFQLSNNGEYLALVKPDAQTIVSQFGSATTNYPPLNEDISFGVGQQTTTATLLAAGASSTTLIPTTANGGDQLGTSWTGAAANEPFDDTAWATGTTAVGYGDFSTPPIATAGTLFVDLDDC